MGKLSSLKLWRRISDGLGFKYLQEGKKVLLPASIPACPH